jgi:hypothetical protein
MTAATPTNRLTRDERVARWNAEAEQGKASQPERLSGKTVRLRWLNAVLNNPGSLKSTPRLVACVLSMHGKPDGTDIFPGVRRLAAQCGLSQRAVCEAIRNLVCGGYLRREWRRGNAAGVGFRYVLTLPVLTHDQHVGAHAESAPVLTQDQHVSADARSAAAEVLTHGQHGADARSRGADANDMKVLTHGQRNSSEQKLTEAHARSGRPDGQRARSERESPEVQRRRQEAAAIAARLAQPKEPDRTP